MVTEFNRRQPKIPGSQMADDGAPPPTPEEWEEARDRLREIAAPDERY